MSRPATSLEHPKPNFKTGMPILHLTMVVGLLAIGHEEFPVDGIEVVDILQDGLRAALRRALQKHGERDGILTGADDSLEIQARDTMFTHKLAGEVLQPTYHALSCGCRGHRPSDTF